LAKLQVLNHLATNATEAADDVVALELVDFLLHASPPQGTTELSADQVLPNGVHRVDRGGTPPGMSVSTATWWPE
jgi:hypothetical protein